MNLLKKVVFLTALAVLTAGVSLQGAGRKTSFAIVIDPESYNEAKAEVDAYAAQIRESGLDVCMVIDRTGKPDSLRNVLKNLYLQKTSPLEGAVLIGDVPIVMVRDAQHMTSAFKMDQKVFEPWQSSVPSDRFYDDFDLEFNYIGADEEHQDTYYYSLAPESPQQLSPDIYTGRIRPTDAGGVSRHEKLRRYLRKVVAAKENPGQLDQILFFSGNGFISESMVARIDEKAALLEHFPWLRKQQNGISYIDHKRESHVKSRVINELQRKDLDYAVLHHHGDWDTQYFNNLPLVNDTGKQIDMIRMFLRESLRHAMSHNIPKDSALARIARRYGTFPENWYDGADDPVLTARDSAWLTDLDLHLEDFRNYHPECRFVSLDACFNGSFHRDNCIASSYIFNEGGTVAVLANSVNVLQDKWTDRFTGLLGLGMKAGNLVKYAPYLEQHLIGDPTFAFVSADPHLDADRLLREDRPGVWKKLLRNEDYPTLQAMAAGRLFEKGMLDAADLLEIFKTSTSSQLRLEALMLLKECRGDEFVEALQLGMEDSYEMIARFCANFLAKSGDARLVPALIRCAVMNNTSERQEFAVKQAMSLFDRQLMLDEFDKQFKTTNYQDAAKVEEAIRNSIIVNADKWIPEMEEIMDPSTPSKRRLQYIRFMRNYPIHHMVPELLEYMKTCGDPTVQQTMLEAFGWFTLSYQRGLILKAAADMSSDTSLAPEVRNEALRTCNRLK